MRPSEEKLNLCPVKRTFTLRVLSYFGRIKQFKLQIRVHCTDISVKLQLCIVYNFVLKNLMKDLMFRNTVLKQT